MLVYVVAGEASGDILGARLMAALKRLRPDVTFAGVGGERMQERGLESLFPMRELSLMGLAEVLPSLRRVLRRLKETEADMLARRPALLLTIDAPSFTLRLAEKVRPQGVKVVHYVAPQLWAWRPGRVKKLPRRVDAMLGLLPFEPAWFAQHGVDVRFVGHPVLESGADQGDAERFRATHGLKPQDTPLLVMPGSRRGEVTRLLPVFGEAVKLLSAQVPWLRPVVAIAGPVEQMVRAGTASWPVPPILVRTDAEKQDAYAASAAGLIKSGTSSLEMAVAGVPHVIGYKGNPITSLIIRKLVHVDYASLVNLLAGKELVPELLLEDCTPQKLAEGLKALLLKDSAAAATQRQGFAEVVAQLRPPGGERPSEAAARAVAEMLQ